MSREYYLDPRMSISHSAEGTSWSNTKYISKKWKNGKWVYTYQIAKKGKAVDKVENTSKKKGNAVPNIAKQIGRTANDVGSKVSKGISDIGKKAKNAVSKTLKKMHDEKRKKYWQKERKTPEYKAKMKAIRDNQENRRIWMEHKFWTKQYYPLFTGVSYDEAKGYSKGHYPEGSKKKDDNKPKYDDLTTFDELLTKKRKNPWNKKYRKNRNK